MKFSGIREFLGGRGDLPVIRQGEVAECGLACLTMVACHHGHDVDLPSMRSRFPTSLGGRTLSSLMRILHQLQLRGRALRVEIEYLPQLKLPCVLHWDLDHFVVLAEVRSGGVVIHDPSEGRRWVSNDEVRRRFTGVALEITPASDFEPMRARERLSIARLVGKVRGVWGAVAQLVGLAIALEVLALSLPFSMQWIVDDVLGSFDVDLLAVILVGFSMVVVCQAMVQAARAHLIGALGASVSAQWIQNLFAHLMRLPFEYFQRRHAGEILSRFHSVEVVKSTLSGSVVESLLDVLALSLIFCVLFAYEPRVAAIVSSSAVAYGALRWLGHRVVYRVNEERLGHEAKRLTQMFESIRSALSIKLSNAQGLRSALVANSSVEVANRDVRSSGLSALFAAASKVLFGMQRIVLLWFGARMVIDAGMTLGALVVVVAYSDIFAARAANFIDNVANIRMLGLHAERIADIAFEPPEADVESGYGGSSTQPDAAIEAKGLRFRYSSDSPWVLDDCSFRVEPGEHVAIVGASGCGKSTLAMVLLGLLRAQEGTVFVGGVDIRRYGLGPFRQMVGVVMQDDQLLSGSVAQNIAMFDPDAQPHDVALAAEAASVHQEILRLPMGYQTPVGDMGSALSGGQKQRIILARALYRKPRILVLDEATSHLDVGCERRVSRRIAALSVTRIVIAHRTETIAAADRVFLLEDGRVAEIDRATAIGLKGDQVPGVAGAAVDAAARGLA